MKEIHPLFKFAAPLTAIFAAWEQNLPALIQKSTHNPTTSMEASASIIALTALVIVVFYIVNDIVKSLSHIYTYFKNNAMERLKLMAAIKAYKQSNKLAEERNKIEEDKLAALENLWDTDKK